MRRTGLFNANATLASDLNIILQILILTLLVGGVMFARFKRHFIRHGSVIGVAVGLNTISIAIVMIPSTLSFRGLFSAPFSNFAYTVIFHSFLGTLVEILGIWLVIRWIFRHHEVKTCAKKKNSMRITVTLWLIELFLGIYIYTISYLPI